MCLVQIEMCCKQKINNIVQECVFFFLKKQKTKNLTDNFSINYTLYLFPKAVIEKYHRLEGLNNRN